MSKLINLPSGATVTIRDAREFKQKDRLKVQLALGDESLSTIERGTRMAETLIAMLIEEWSFDLIPPNVKPESLGELSLGDYDVLEAEGTKAMAVLFPALRDAESDPDSPLQK